jgi:hypothetical protein
LLAFGRSPDTFAVPATVLEGVKVGVNIAVNIASRTSTRETVGLFLPICPMFFPAVFPMPAQRGCEVALLSGSIVAKSSCGTVGGVNIAGNFVSYP